MTIRGLLYKEASIGSLPAVGLDVAAWGRFPLGKSRALAAERLHRRQPNPIYNNRAGWRASLARSGVALPSRNWYTLAAWRSSSAG
jgi:hypothetical protein